MFQRRSLMSSVLGSLVLAAVFVLGVGSTMAFAHARVDRVASKTPVRSDTGDTHKTNQAVTWADAVAPRLANAHAVRFEVL